MFDPERSSKRSEVIELESQEYLGYETKIYRSLKWYMRLRLIEIALPFLFILLPDQEPLLFKM